LPPAAGRDTGIRVRLWYGRDATGANDMSSDDPTDDPRFTLRKKLLALITRVPDADFTGVAANNFVDLIPIALEQLTVAERDALVHDALTELLRDFHEADARYKGTARIH
jgi:hypothetical protein